MSSAGRQPPAGLMPALLVELLRGGLLLDAVALVLALDLLDLGLQQLGLARGDELLAADRGRDDLEDDRQQDDRDARCCRSGQIQYGGLVEQHQGDEQRLEDRREQPGQQVHRVGARLRGRRAAPGSSWGTAPPEAARGGRARHARGEDQRDGDQEQDRRQPDEELLEAGHAVLLSVRGPGRSRPGSRDGTGRCAWRPSRSPAAARISGSPARCSASTRVRTGSSRAARRTRAGTGGSSPPRP